MSSSVFEYKRNDDFYKLEPTSDEDLFCELDFNENNDDFLESELSLEGDSDFELELDDDLDDDFLELELNSDLPKSINKPIENFLKPSDSKAFFELLFQCLRDGYSLNQFDEAVRSKFGWDVGSVYLPLVFPRFDELSDYGAVNYLVEAWLDCKTGLREVFDHVSFMHYMVAERNSSLPDESLSRAEEGTELASEFADTLLAAGRTVKVVVYPSRCVNDLYNVVINDVMTHQVDLISFIDQLTISLAARGLSESRVSFDFTHAFSAGETKYQLATRLDNYGMCFIQNQGKSELRVVYELEGNFKVLGFAMKAPAGTIHKPERVKTDELVKHIDSFTKRSLTIPPVQEWMMDKPRCNLFYSEELEAWLLEPINQ
jgi:hypothetical protein